MENDDEVQPFSLPFSNGLTISYGQMPQLQQLNVFNPFQTQQMQTQVC